MKFYNAQVFLSGRFETAGFETENGRFTRVFTDEEAARPDAAARDLQGAYVIPGLVDIHIHGALGSDFSDGDCTGLKRMAAYLLSRGITSFVPASATVPYEQLGRAYENAARLHEESPRGLSYLAGIHMEGPFFSKAKKGAQNEAYLKEPDADAFRALQAQAKGLIRQADVAPELPGALDFIREISRECTVSLAHSAAGYDEARAGFDAGITHVTHLYNAMTGLAHREPGAVGAAAEREDVFAELISDGHHVHPAAVRAAFRLFPGRICLISDALCCLGMPEGRYRLGGQDVFVYDHLAHLADGTIAGAASDLYQDMRSAVSFGVPKEEAILAATYNPARSLGLDGELGAIAPGLRADFLVVDEELTLREIHAGESA